MGIILKRKNLRELLQTAGEAGIPALLSGSNSEKTDIIIPPLVEQLRNDCGIASLRQAYQCFASDLRVRIAQSSSQCLANLWCIGIIRAPQPEYRPIPDIAILLDRQSDQRVNREVVFVSR
jgi:hypothetical protein